jgi:hypothetical protein
MAEVRRLSRDSTESFSRDKRDVVPIFTQSGRRSIVLARTLLMKDDGAARLQVT